MLQLVGADELGDDLWWQVQKTDGSTGVVPASYLAPASGDDAAQQEPETFQSNSRDDLVPSMQ
jgi:hypothetical protein